MPAYPPPALDFVRESNSQFLHLMMTFSRLYDEFSSLLQGAIAVGIDLLEIVPSKAITVVSLLSRAFELILARKLSGHLPKFAFVGFGPKFHLRVCGSVFAKPRFSVLRPNRGFE